jgi:hypothetical protein
MAVSWVAACLLCHRMWRVKRLRCQVQPWWRVLLCQSTMPVNYPTLIFAAASIGLSNGDAMPWHIYAQTRLHVSACETTSERGAVAYRPSAQFTQADIDAFRAERMRRGDDSFGRSVRPGRDIPTG